MSDLKEKVIEIAEIATSLPENLQQTCFELLLKNHFALQAGTLASAEGRTQDWRATFPSEVPVPEEHPDASPSLQDVVGAQADLTSGDIHVKVRRFLEKYDSSVADLNNLFYKEGQEIKSLYEDLKTTRTAESQIRITLLQSLCNALVSGEFRASVEEVRTECRDRKCYDGKNFAANYKNNESLFDFDKYTKDTTEVRLSEAGRKELAQLVKELQ